MRWNIDESWTLFLDRDGVINKRNYNGYITKSDEFEFTPSALEAISILSEIFKHIIIVTNQQGIAKKIMTQRNLEDIHRYMVKEIKNKDGRIDAIYFADNFRNAEFDRRKPNPDMALEAKKDFPDICFEKSVMVGDTNSDLLFGMNLGMKTVLVKSEEHTTVIPDLEINNLMELVEKLNINYE